MSKKIRAAENEVQDIAKTLVDVADALDEKGAFEEAAMADSLLQEIPEVFTVEDTAAPTEQVTETPKAGAPAAEAPKVEVPEGETPKTEAPKGEGTPFSQLKEEKKEEPKKEVPVNPEIKVTKETIPEMDEVSLQDFQSLIDSMKLRISQGPKRKIYEQVLERARKAEEYKKAGEEWLAHAHKLLDEHKEPIRIKL